MKLPLSAVSRFRRMVITFSGRAVIRADCNAFPRGKLGPYQARPRPPCISLSSPLMAGSLPTALQAGPSGYSPLAELRGHHQPAKNLAFSSDGKTLAVSQRDSVKLWDLESQRALMVLPTSRTSNTRYVKFTADGRQLLFGGPDEPLSAWTIGE